MVVALHGAEVAQVRCRDGARADGAEPGDGLCGGEAVAADEPGGDEGAGAALAIAELHGDTAFVAAEGKEALCSRVGAVEGKVAKAGVLQGLQVTFGRAVDEHHAGNAEVLEGRDEVRRGEGGRRSA